MSSVLIFEAATQGISMDCLVLVTKAACIGGSPGTVTIRDTVLGRLSPLEHCTDRRPKYTPPFP